VLRVTSVAVVNCKTALAPTAAAAASTAAAALTAAAASTAAVLPAEATTVTAHPALAATAALRKRNKAAAGERRAVLAKKRDGDEVGTPETLRWSEMELPELDLSLDSALIEISIEN
jgi:hypothetical protein